MIVLHAGIKLWAHDHGDHGLLLWGEQPIDEGGGSPSRRRRKRTPDAYPFGAGLEELASALGAAGVYCEAGRRRGQEVTAWLPSRGGMPVPSSPLIAEPPPSRLKVGLAPWNIQALLLVPAETVELLCACAGRQTVAPGVVVGRDLAFWAQALRLAGALVARQQYLPDLEARDGRYRACWEPVFAGADADHLVALAKRMPPVARALSGPGAAAPPSMPAVEALKVFIREMVDYLVRSGAPEGTSPPPEETSPSSPQRQSPKRRSHHRARARLRPAFDSVHDHWLHALSTGDGLMEGNEAELAQLAVQVREWRRPVTLAAASPFRLCFRLEEPAAGGLPAKEAGEMARRAGSRAARDDKWYVRFLLQAADDPSLLIPVQDAWKARGRKATALTRNGFDAREYLLSSLGQAAGICPRIAASLKTAEPAGYELDTAGAHEFLTEKAVVLEQAGFGVMLPAWWTRKGTKVRLAVRARVKSPRLQGASGLSLEEMVNVDWEVALGDQVLSLQELQALASLKAPLVQVRGQWVQVSAEEIQAALVFWKEKAGRPATVREIVRMALGATGTVGGMAFEGVRATGWIAELLGQLEGRAPLAEQPVPPGFAGTLRPYQARGYSWLCFLRQWGLGACLADDMGLGKTVQTLALIQRDWETRRHREANGQRPVLLVCPTSVVNNWQKEAARFTPDLPVMVHHGIDRKKGAAFRKAAQKQAMVISSYALLQRDLEDLRQVDWAGVVLDEAQNIKNPETRQAHAARSLVAGYRLALTGTPVENHVGDLWSIMEFLNPGFLGTEAQFRRSFFIPIQAGRDPEAARLLKQITGPFILRRLKTDRSIIADLPDKLETKVFCTLTREQASLYAAVLKDAERALESAEGIQRKGVILATLSRLKQVCNHPAQLLGDNSPLPGRSGKLARLVEMLEEVMAVGDRALVFSQFAEMGELLKRHLQETFGREVLFLHGGVPKGQRDRMVERFQADGDGPPVFILSLKAGGTGLNLTRASHVFHFDRWWNPAVENQATDRAFRIGQARNVQVHKFLCAGTLEEKIDELIEQKQAVAGEVVGTGEGWLTGLSNQQLREIFALRKEALGE